MKKVYKKLMSKHKKVKGFTLIEMVIVIAIIAILILLIVPGITEQKDKANKRTDEAFISTLQTQVELAEEKDKKNITLDVLKDKKLITDKQYNHAKDEKITIDNGKVVQHKE